MPTVNHTLKIPLTEGEVLVLKSSALAFCCRVLKGTCTADETVLLPSVLNIFELPKTTTRAKKDTENG